MRSDDAFGGSMVEESPDRSAIWFPSLRTNRAARLRLFCFPYAGGSAAVFTSWRRHLPDAVELVPVQLPKRGSRFNEPAIVRMDALVGALLDAIASCLDRPYAFFGHSMGALVAFELTRGLRRASLRMPEHLFASGCRAPQLPDTDPIIYTLPDQELLARVLSLNGTPQEVADNQELVDLLLPTLRADFELIDTFLYRQEEPLPCPISAWGGREDPEVEHAELEQWCAQTSSRFSVRFFPGGHLFVNAVTPMVLAALEGELTAIVRNHA